MWWQKILVIVGLLPVAAVVGLMVLFISMKGAANHAESTCYADIDARPGHGAWSMSGEFWPPSFSCEIAGLDVPTITIHHPSIGILALVAAVVIPAAYVACVAVSIWWFARRPGEGRRTVQMVG